MRIIFKNLKILWSIINALHDDPELTNIIEAAGSKLSHLFDIVSFSILLKKDLDLYIYCGESTSQRFVDEVARNTIKTLVFLTGERLPSEQVHTHIERRRFESRWMEPSEGRLKSHISLPLINDGKVLGCTSLNSDHTNAFDAQALQFFSLITYQMASSMKASRVISSMKDMATFDMLTQLYNRTYLNQVLEVEFRNSLQNRQPLSIIMVDIDHFKAINDQYGHDEGDRALIHIASLLKGSLRKHDIVARFGGEEFLVVLPKAIMKDAVVIAERIRKSVETTPLSGSKEKVHFTVSLGIASIPAIWPESKEEFIKCADTALYEAKEKGRNRVCFYVSTTDPPAKGIWLR
ncbi:MAG: GGDEF domain-containing protein [Deltaproteobacteria bacterium]|nr:GGDEF domain-containing protein [Deltaproteobacteria bacterium]